MSTSRSATGAESTTQLAAVSPDQAESVFNPELTQAPTCGTAADTRTRSPDLVNPFAFEDADSENDQPSGSLRTDEDRTAAWRSDRLDDESYLAESTLTSEDSLEEDFFEEDYEDYFDREAPAAEDEARAVLDLPPESSDAVLRALRIGRWSVPIARALLHGQDDPDTLTDMIFYTTYPEMVINGRRLKVPYQNHPLAVEWEQIRRDTVLPILAGLRATTSAAAAAAPAGSDGGTEVWALPVEGPFRSPAEIDQEAADWAETDTEFNVEGDEREDGPPIGESPWDIGEMEDEYEAEGSPPTRHGGGRTSIPSSQLRWYGPGQATPELMAFMRNVYERHVAWSRQRGRTFVDTLPESAIATIETTDGRTHQAQREAARWAKELLRAARADLAAEGLAGRHKIGITSAYRSAAQQFDIWQGKGGHGNHGFPYYYEKKKPKPQQSGDEHGAKAAADLVAYMGKYVAAPGYSNHQDGLAIDFGTGIAGKRGLGKLRKKSWFYNWLTQNARRFHFWPYPAEPWHWNWRPDNRPSVAREANLTEETLSSPVIRAGRLEVGRSPTLAPHRDIPPDVVLRWNDMPSPPSGADVVIHLHGYSRLRMKLAEDIEPWSGLDLSPPKGQKGPRRTRPTLTILPRGHSTGEHRGEVYRYTFPALTTKNGLTKLIDESLARFARDRNVAVPTVRRMIITAHSGGGAALMSILRHHDPHEVHVYDALYQDATPLAKWAVRHIRQDSAGTATGAMRVFYRHGTHRFSRQLLTDISTALESAPQSIQDRYRVETTSVGHRQIPRQYGWRILANPAADVPGAHRATVGKRVQHQYADENDSSLYYENNDTRVFPAPAEFEDVDDGEDFAEPHDDRCQELADEYWEELEDEFSEEPEGEFAEELEDESDQGYQSEANNSVINDLQEDATTFGAKAHGESGQPDADREQWQQQGYSESPRAHRLPSGPMGTLVLKAPGIRQFSYTFTPEDALWAAKLIVLEAGGRDDADNAAVLWAMFNRFAMFTRTRYRTFGDFIRAYSTTLQPVLLNPRAAARHMNSPEFQRIDGMYPHTNIPRGQLKRHIAVQRQPWTAIREPARSLTLRTLQGKVPNPGIGLASEFASTRLLWQHAHKTKRIPTHEEWRQYTQGFGRAKRPSMRWIRDVDGINQMKNAFFLDRRAETLPAGSVKVVSPYDGYVER